jgi:hypothetical protein
MAVHDRIVVWGCNKTLYYVILECHYCTMDVATTVAFCATTIVYWPYDPKVPWRMMETIVNHDGLQRSRVVTTTNQKISQYHIGYWKRSKDEDWGIIHHTYRLVMSSYRHLMV